MIVSIGLIELHSIARGIEASDAMLKAGAVTLDFAKPVCPGKFIVMVHGDVAAVKAAMAAGLEVGAGSVVNHLTIPKVHPTLIPAINAVLEPPEKVEALGVVEYFDIASAIVGADAAAKVATVTLIEVRLGMGIGGKSFFKLCGEVADVRSSVAAAVEIAQERTTIVSTCVIPAPDPTLFREMI